MKIDSESIAIVQSKSEVAVGNLYPGMGGRSNPGTKYWLVIAVTEKSAHLVGFDESGNAVSTASYLLHAVRERPVLGKFKVTITKEG